MSAFEQHKKNLLKHPRKWLVTGCAGFIGSHLLEFLLLHNQQVVGIDNFSTGKKSNLDLVRESVGKKNWENFSFTEGDIRNLKDCTEIISGVDYVLHQAALGSVPRSIQYPIASHESNIDGFVNMIFAAKEAAVKSFVYASSSSVYGTNTDQPKVEEKVGDLISPYALTKKVNEMYAAVFNKCYGLQTIGLRYFNVFGPRQDPNGMYAAVIPLWIKSMVTNADVFINGDGSTSRDFTYVENVVELNICAALCENSNAFGQVYNGALGGSVSLLELYSKIRELVSTHLPGSHIADPVFREFRKGDILNSKADISKAYKHLGYEPKIDFDNGLSKTVSFFVRDLVGK